MKRFSQRSHLVTLSEINITPLLDLAFVLLIIFVITTPLLEKGMELKLPRVGGQSVRPPDKKDVRTVEISAQGVLMLDKRRLSSLGELEAALVAAARSNPNTVVYIRADEKAKIPDLYAVIDRCQRNGITRFSLRTHLPENK
jgi:biopolymer transport protein ExbD